MCEGIFLKLEMVCCQFYETIHSRAGKTLMRNQSLFMGPSQGQRAMLGGPEFVFWEILANGGGQKKSKNWNDISCSEFQIDYDALFMTSMQ